MQLINDDDDDDGYHFVIIQPLPEMKSNVWLLTMCSHLTAGPAHNIAVARLLRLVCLLA
jgi:hypothetical protein